MEHLFKMGEGNATLNRSLSGGKDLFLAVASLYQREGVMLLLLLYFSCLFSVSYRRRIIRSGRWFSHCDFRGEVFAGVLYPLIKLRASFSLVYICDWMESTRIATKSMSARISYKITKGIIIS
jgi:hypothetical protein